MKINIWAFLLYVDTYSTKDPLAAVVFCDKSSILKVVEGPTLPTEGQSAFWCQCAYNYWAVIFWYQNTKQCFPHYFLLVTHFLLRKIRYVSFVGYRVTLCAFWVHFKLLKTIFALLLFE